jgi:hypothetical protein
MREWLRFQIIWPGASIFSVQTLTRGSVYRVNEMYLVDLAWQEPIDKQQFDKEIKTNSVRESASA